MLLWAAANSVQFTQHTPHRNHAPPLRRSHPAIYATSISQRRSSQPPDDDDSNVSVGGGLGRAVLTAFRSQPTTHDDGTRTGKTKLLNEKQGKGEGDEEKGKETSGFDILLALQKASAQKKNKKKIGTSISKSKDERQDRCGRRRRER